MLRTEAGGIFTKIEASPSSEDIATIERGLYHYEEVRLGSPSHAQFAVFMRDPTGHIQGGVDAHVMWHRLFIKTLWVSEFFRNRGFGSKLLELAEQEALARHCRGIWLTALGARACRFYTDRGYAVVGEISDYVAGEALFTVEKRFP